MKQIAYTCNWSSISVSEMRDTYNHTLDVVGSSTAWIANHSNQSINALGFVLLHTLTHSLCLQCVPLSSHYHWPYCHTVAKMHNQLLCMPFVQVLCAPILSHCTEDINFIFRSFFFMNHLKSSKRTINCFEKSMISGALMCNSLLSVYSCICPESVDNSFSWKWSRFVVVVAIIQ